MTLFWGNILVNLSKNTERYCHESCLLLFCLAFRFFWGHDQFWFSHMDSRSTNTICLYVLLLCVFPCNLFPTTKRWEVSKKNNSRKNKQTKTKQTYRNNTACVLMCHPPASWNLKKKQITSFWKICKVLIEVLLFLEIVGGTSANTHSVNVVLMSYMNDQDLFEVLPHLFSSLRSWNDVLSSYVRI